jgi:hypothetical protein
MQLAMHFHLTEVEQLGDDEMHEVLTQILAKVECKHSASEVLNHLRERTALLVGPGTWSFLHKNISEFLVASAIWSGDQVDEDGQRLDRLRLFKDRNNDRWLIVLFFWAGLASPGDLQSFIVQVSDEQNDADLLLALSLMYDQMLPHRLSEPWRSKLLLKLLRRGLSQSNWSTCYGWSPFAVDMVTHTSVSMPDPPLPSPEPVDLRDALCECLRVSKITWEQAATAHKSLLLISWFFFATRPRTVEDLQCALKYMQANSLSGEWAMSLIVGGARFASKVNTGLSFEEFMSVLCKTIPELAARVIYILLVWFIESIEIAPANLQISLEAIDVVRDIEVDADWLLRSIGFTDIFYSKKPFDLLEVFLQSLDEAVAKVWVSEGPTVDNVRAFVEDLRTRRNAALAAKPSRPRHKTN